MKQGFGRIAAETYAEREARLQKAADAIDQRLNTPETPQMHLRPTGQMRIEGDRIGREAMQERRDDLQKEIERIKQERPLGQQMDGPNKSKSI
ncbi:hypothetical protein [Ponticaulis sp.]|uniref:hypothetical protein n=1 Tax=Ponticaulis sp. TaxID=2020902 RepID=UPI000B68BC49|nr:hypothetical protein [Ponticaulis sp.]MAI91319.1 hypothetical protein [Ponticaulis sp.]OUX97920.1 MAG: hypothetical protein CBB65_12815 [Hyphomonadaceae bacterium TMED5]|tara:strand:+ start:59196 stop:59474 length:279 start_codon:yes stop_codon:yes gene_type:complete